ncbi:S-layer homology domain-containing protein [Planococcus halocryophilus]|uniref:S-layer homology domain-containing protein n=1 Tax=Planococcus halocryophilus TaxID=1215089 RepID=UPI001F105B15|nr:S-layer homology domain-containing protein [Planococcus halocryophilus]MCH4826808.1 S-layer homology domain-containing protein [Planococcus halocryophilus]
MKKFLFLTSGVLAFSLLGSPALAASDLPENHRFYDEIDYLVGKKVISGYEDGTMQPDRVVTRAEAAIMIGKLKGLDGTQRATNFSDVGKSSKASGYIASAQKAGYLSGYPDGTFHPDATITRGDMAIVLANVFTTPLSLNSGFKDISPNMKAYASISEIVAYNIAAGYPDRTYRPLTDVTRGQFSAFLARGLEPFFKNDTHMKNSYLRDKTKTYSYKSANGEQWINYFTNNSQLNDEPLGFVWATKASNGTVSFFTEYETYDSYDVCYPFSECITDLVYPIQKGKVFNIDNPFAPESTITGVNVSVKTAYKTFTNAVEVTIPYNETKDRDTGYKYYMVEGFGTVKALKLDGTVVSELVKVE